MNEDHIDQRASFKVCYVNGEKGVSRVIKVAPNRSTWNYTTPLYAVLLEKLIVTQLIKKFLTFCETWMSLTVLTKPRHWTLSWASLIQSTPSHSVSF
jgi:hypothetical protein